MRIVAEIRCSAHNIHSIRWLQVHRMVCNEGGHPFITMLFGTFQVNQNTRLCCVPISCSCMTQDRDHLYMCMEFLQGGELYGLLYEEFSTLTGGKGGMKEADAQFYVACVILMLEYLHTDRSCVYRDLKMENLVLDKQGYPKLVDLGFAIHLPGDMRTYTRCGSPEYMAVRCIHIEDLTF